MYLQKIGLSVGNEYGRPMEEVLQIIKKAGFEAVSPVWESQEALEALVGTAAELGLELSSVHAPFHKAHTLWSPEEAVAAPAKNEMKAVIDACAQFSVPVVVAHVWIGFDYRFEKEGLVFKHFDQIVAHAKERGVTVAFENTEGEEYLFALMERYAGEEAVGFCWDSGHEACYNRSQDLLGKLGDRLVMTHLNDNLGISRFDGRIFWTDDLHLLPYDGIIDWENAIARLKKAKPLSVLNFELTRYSKPHRHDNDAYTAMPVEQYLALVYQRACRIAYRYARGE